MPCCAQIFVAARRVVVQCAKMLGRGEERGGGGGVWGGGGGLGEGGCGGGGGGGGGGGWDLGQGGRRNVLRLNVMQHNPA